MSSGWCFGAVIHRIKADAPENPELPERPGTSVAAGCPFDCGLCPDHRQQTCTALLEVTRRCNLRCIFCFADAGSSRTADADMTTIRGWYEALLETHRSCNIQLSGGEPTVREDLPTLWPLAGPWDSDSSK